MPKRERDSSIQDFFSRICKRTKTKKAILLVGTPGSGKSTVSKLFPDYTVISRDKGIEQGKDWKGAQILFTKEKNDVIRNNQNFIWDTTCLNKNDIVHMINICNDKTMNCLSILFNVILISLKIELQKEKKLLQENIKLMSLIFVMIK